MESIRAIEEAYEEIPLDKVKPILHYAGTFTESVIGEMGEFLRGHFRTSPETLGKNFAIFIEMATNIALHSFRKEGRTERGEGIMEVYALEDKIYLAASNIVQAEEYARIEAHVKHINTLSQEELRALKRNIREQPKQALQKGGNIGLVQISLKADAPLFLSYEALSEEYYFMTLHTCTTFTKKSRTEMNTSFALENIRVEGAKGTYYTPQVHFDAATGQCSVAGESYLEDAFEFYDKLTAWVVNYFKLGGQSLQLRFKLSYFNTSSSRAIADLIRVIGLLQQEGKQAEVYWYYPEPDYDDIRMEGEDFAAETGCQMHFEAYQ